MKAEFDLSGWDYSLCLVLGAFILFHGLGDIPWFICPWVLDYSRRVLDLVCHFIFSFISVGSKSTAIC